MTNINIHPELEKLRSDLLKEMKNYHLAIELCLSLKVQRYLRSKILRLQKEIREQTLMNGYHFSKS